MPLKITAGLSRKHGLPDYGSIGASCHVELEVSNDLLDSDLEGFHRRVRSAYVACSQAVNDELARQRDQSPVSVPAASKQSTDTHGGGNGNGNGREITSKQLAYARQLAGQVESLGARRLDPLANKLYGKVATELSSFEGSQLIDMLKEIKAGRVALPAELDGVTS